MEPEISISERQWMLMLTSSFAAPALFTFARDIAIGAGRQALWSALVIIAVGLLSAWLMAKVGLMYPGMDNVAFARAAFGNKIAMVVNVWWMMVFGGFVAVTLRQFGDLVNTFFLIRTPVEMIMLLMVMVVVYINWHGLETVARFVSIALPVTAVGITITFAATLVKASETAALLPPAGFDPWQVMQGSWNAMYVIIGVEAGAALTWTVRTWKRPVGMALLSVAINGFLLLLILMTTLGVWGVEPIAHLEYPGVAALRVLRLPGMLVERLGAFIALGWTVLALCFICVHFWTIPITAARLFGLDSREFRYFLLPLSVAMLFVARIPVSHTEMERWLHQFFVPFGTVSVVVSPTVLLILGWLKGRRGQRT